MTRPAVRLDPVRSRRGRANRRRGNDFERSLAAELGGRRIGQYGDPADVLTPLFVVQAKVRKAFPYWMTRELDRLPRADGRIPLLVVSDSPGPGRRRRSVVVVDLRDWVDLHGVES
jgi:hypothetical protein